MMNNNNTQEQLYDDWETALDEPVVQEVVNEPWTPEDLVAAVKLQIQIKSAEKRLHDLDLLYKLREEEIKRSKEADFNSVMTWWRKILEAQIPDKNVLQEQLEEREQRAYKKNNAALKTELGSLKVKQSQEKQSLEESVKEVTKKFKEYDRKGALFAKEVEQLVKEFYDSTKLIVPRSDFDLRLGAIDSPLLESFLVKALHKDQIMANNLLADEEEVFEERMLKVLTSDGNAAGSPFNFLFQQKFNWNTGKLLNASIIGDKHDHRGNKQSWTLFMDKTAESLSVERAPETLEFSQNLRIYVEIFIEGDDIKEPEVSFCKKCGADLKNHDKCPKCKAAKGEGNDCCAACGKKNKPDWKFCARCKKVNFPQDVYDVAALNNIRNTPDRQLRLRRELFSVLKDRNMSKQFKADTCLKILAFSLSWSIDDCNKDPSAENVAAVFQCIHDLYMNFKRHLSKHHTVSALMAHTLETLGFGPISKALHVTLNDGTTDEIKGAGFNFLHKVVKAKDGKEVFTKNYIDFQFLHLGENFVREIAPRLEEHKDVKFFPDQWQYDVIQRIKQDKSALVVAPTSTGKTFISFYTITRVLEKTKADAKAKSTDTDMKSRIVFVAPSTPLVNQMGANIYKRYKGENVTFGLFTSEYRENVENCDILVCTPQVLYNLLISPASQAWASRLQYVIFDEIHCIGTQDDDSSLRSSYAKSLAFVPCPFLALSATVQAPAKLQSWLETVTSQEVALLPKAPIQPWNDIQRYQFVPPNEDKSSQLVKMNPIVLADKAERLQFLPHLHLRPEEVHEIWVALKKELGEDKLKSLLKSDEFFAQHGFIKRDDSRKFQQELFRVYIEDLTAEQREHVGKSLLNFTDQDGIETQSTKDAATQFIDLLRLMKQRTLLPTIAFWYEGGFVLDLVEQVAAQLEAMEPKKEYIELPKVEKDKKVVNDKKDPNEEVKMSHKQLAKMWRYHAINAKLQQVREYSLNVTEKCSFLARELFSHEDVIFWMRRLFEKTGWSSRHPLVLALTRGIASYSQALPKPYRDLVETLFRAGALTVIVGTPILSLGLNMPSKTTVFLRNSPGLSPLDAVQMEGRAGRRGFDNLGNVVYFYMNKNRIADLIYSPIQELVTPNLIDIDTALNCLILHNQAKDKTLAHDKIAHLKVAPLSSTFTKDAGQQAEIDASRSLRYSAEFLYRLKLIDDKARPIGLAGLAAHSIDISPYNYLLAFLIHSGALDNIVATYNMLPSGTMTKEKIASERSAANETLMTILSYLILPRKITGDTQTKPAPTLPANARAIMEEYNTIVTRVNESVNKAFETLGLAPIDHSLSPLIDTCKDGECNGYAVNFYKNKQVKFLAKDNNMSDYDAYATLKQWDSILRKLTAAFKQLASDNVYDPLYTAFAAVTEEFHEAFESISY